MAWYVEKYISRLLRASPPLDLVPRIAERREGLVLGVVDEDVAIREVEDARLAELAGAVPAGGPQPPADLECDDGLAGPRCERQQDASLALEDRLGRAVDRDVLVVARCARLARGSTGPGAADRPGSTPRAAQSRRQSSSGDG